MCQASDSDSKLPDILLDPVGVFTQGTDSTAGSIFSSVARLIETDRSQNVGEKADAAQTLVERDGEPSDARRTTPEHKGQRNPYGAAAAAVFVL